MIMIALSGRNESPYQQYVRKTTCLMYACIQMSSCSHCQHADVSCKTKCRTYTTKLYLLEHHKTGVCPVFRSLQKMVYGKIEEPKKTASFIVARVTMQTCINTRKKITKSKLKLAALLYSKGNMSCAIQLIQKLPN